MAKARDRLREKAGLCPPVHPSHQDSSSPHLCCSYSSFFPLNNEQANCLPRVAPERTKPLTQDTCSMGSTISYTDLGQNLEKGVCQTRHPSLPKQTQTSGPQRAL